MGDCDCLYGCREELSSIDCCEDFDGYYGCGYAAEFDAHE